MGKNGRKSRSHNSTHVPADPGLLAGVEADMDHPDAPRRPRKPRWCPDCTPNRCLCGYKPALCVCPGGARGTVMA